MTPSYNQLTLEESIQAEVDQAEFMRKQPARPKWPEDLPCPRKCCIKQLAKMWARSNELVVERALQVLSRPA
jgi:hypothetical protein